MNFSYSTLRKWYRCALICAGLVFFAGCKTDPLEGPGDVDAGEEAFFGAGNCASCHASNGDGTFTQLNIDDLQTGNAQRHTLTNYIYLFMPPGPDAETTCDVTCAENIAAFLRVRKDEGGSGSVVDGTAHLRGEELFDSIGCAGCHQGERVTGLFNEDNLRAHGLYRRDDLRDYIAESMPPENPSVCDADCASDVAAYLYTWLALPINPSLQRDKIAGAQDVDPKSLGCNQYQAAGERTLKMLTHQEYANTLNDLFGFNEDITYLLPVDDRLGSFINNKQVWVRSSIEYSGIIQAAEAVAEWAINNNFRFAGCNNLDQNCANRFIDEFAPMIFRRQLTDEERDSYLAMANGQALGGDVGEGLRIALAAMLSSPQFLYRHEIGDIWGNVDTNIFQLSSFEVATFLSYTFTRSTPQGSLWQAALDDQLRDPGRIRLEASELLNTPAAQAILDEWVHDWLSTRNLLGANKDTNIWANVDQVKQAMLTELSLVFRNTMLDESASFSDLYAPGSTYINSVLANHYGISGAAGDNFSEVATGERGGILLSGAFLSHHGDFDEASPIRRAVYIRRDMLCQYMPPPPPDVSVGRDAKAQELVDYFAVPSTTNRMRFHRLTEGQICRDCHAEAINPLGFGLEDFDGFGVYRQVDEQGNSVLASGRLYSPFLGLQFFGDPERDTTYHEFQGGAGIANLLASGEVSTLAKTCLAMQFYNYATGILVDSITEAPSPSAQNLEELERDGYHCDVQSMVGTMSRESPRSMLEQLGSLDSILYRRAWNR